MTYQKTLFHNLLEGCRIDNATILDITESPDLLHSSFQDCRLIRSRLYRARQSRAKIKSYL